MNRLTLQNVGTFAGKQTLDLTPPDRNHPVLLIGGLNGAGKTTVLEAIQLALYGPLLRTNARGKGSYERYLRGLVHRHADATKGAAIELEFTAYQAGEKHHYWIRRSWKPAGASLREILLVSVDGRHDAVLTENWQEYVETFLPRGIAGLFFFDGEQIEALADLDRSREVLRSALDALLGMDLVTRLTADLAVLRKRHQSEQLSSVDQESVAQVEAALHAARDVEEVALHTLADARTSAARADEALRRADEAYRDAGGHLADRRDDAERVAEQATTRKRSIEDDLRALAAGDAPLLLVLPLLTELLTQAQREEISARDSLLVGVLDDRDAEVLRWLEESNADPELVSAVRGKLDADRSGRTGAPVESVTGLAGAAPVSLLTSHLLPGTGDSVASLLTAHGAAVEAADEADRVLASIPHPEALAPVAAARDDAAHACTLARAMVAVAEDAAEKARATRERASAAYDKSLERLTQADLAAADDRRIVEHVSRAQHTLERLRIAGTRRHLARIADLVLEALQMLLRKDRLITGVTIDSETTSVELVGSDSLPLSAGDLSAGERQLLAVALLWGLARAAGQPLPVVIDTPLGRLDRSHRDRLLERYFPHASHQVILLSTDTEIDEPSREALHPFIGREYRLEFANGATTVVPGYFWEQS
nr:DNA sulfur modification protein DndD [Microbacterium invictum]